MTNTSLRPWAGTLFAIIGAAAFVLNLSSPPTDFLPAPFGEGFHLELTLMGKNWLRLPVGAGEVVAARWVMRFALPFLAMFLGAFLLYLDTAAGARFETSVRKRLTGRDT